MSNLKQQLRNLDVSKLKLKNGNTVEKELKHHAAILANCIMEEIDELYESYSPKVYSRSYDLYNSLYIDDVIHIDISAKGTSLSIHLGFDEGAIHEGIMGDEADVALLLNDGYRTYGSFANVPMFGWRTGKNFIENGITAYKKKVKNPFPVRLEKNNEEYYF